MAKRNDVQDIANRNADPQVLSVVLVTLTPTFSGSVATYETVTGSVVVGAPASQKGTATVNTSPSGGFDFNSATSSKTKKHKTHTDNSSTSSPVETSSFTTTPLTSAIAATTLVTTSSIPTSSFSQISSNTAFAAASATASHAASSTSQSGMSGAAKAGLAIALILIIGAVAVGALLLYSKKKKQQQDDFQRQEDEKTAFAAVAAARSTMSDQPSRNSPAPRLSLRPVSKLLPELMGGSKKRASQGNPLSTFNQPPVSTVGAGRALTPSPRAASPWERRAEDKSAPTQNPFNDPPNPFADSARAAPPVSAIPSPTTNPAVAAGIAGTAAGAGLAAMAAVRAESPNPQTPRPAQSPAQGLPQRPVQGPAPTPMPVATAIPAPLSGRSSPANGPPAGNVYRIQMDFKPSMDDEIELRAGQLVRMIHEYDDGWALCTRLDRSQQGVAPRTCLAANPSKPRPTNGPRGPGPNQPRPIGPPNGRMSPAMGRPMSPANQSPRMQPQHSPAMNSPRPGPGPSNGSRSASPGPGAYNLAPRPLSPGPRPAQKRSMSPGPYGPGGAQRPVMPAGQRRRSNSASNIRERRDSPPGPSKLGPGPGPSRSASPGIAM